MKRDFDHFSTTSVKMSDELEVLGLSHDMRSPAQFEGQKVSAIVSWALEQTCLITGCTSPAQEAGSKLGLCVAEITRSRV